MMEGSQAEIGEESASSQITMRASASSQAEIGGNISLKEGIPAKCLEKHQWFPKTQRIHFKTCGVRRE
ncbi:hypothetical protein SESBI_15626 [Sesbania bispinosa]|nr:hypothetical protein SESBI_15626 [Sesbania bispinosa]